MSKGYIFIILVLAATIFGLLLLPKLHYCSNDKVAKLHYNEHNCNNVGPKGLLLEAINSHRYIDADKLASKIIGEDPSYTFIDLRNEEQFKSFSFPDAINIPYNTILEEFSELKFDSEKYTYVLFSNETILADQAWLSLRKNGFMNILVLEGGINDFYKKILNPTKPVETDSKEEQELYNFRKAAGIYFGLPNPDEFIPEIAIVQPVKRVNSTSKRIVSSKKKVIVKPKATLEEEEEGC